MKIVAIIFMLFCMLKGFFYGKYELFENKNKFGGITIVFLSVISFILNSIVIFT